MSLNAPPSHTSDQEGRPAIRRRVPLVRVIGGLTVAMFVLGACATRPATEDLADSVLRAGSDEGIELTNDEAACIADQLMNADLADATLAGLAEDFDNPEVSAADVDRVEQAVATAAVACAGG